MTDLQFPQDAALAVVRTALDEDLGPQGVDVTTDAVVIEATGTSEKLRALLDVLEPFGIRELVQSGMVALGRGSRSITDRSLRSA